MHDSAPSIDLGTIKKPTLQVRKKYDTLITARLRELHAAAGDHAYRTPESFLALPSDTDMERKVKAMVDTLRSPALQYIFLVGIGGSSAGAEAVISAITGASDAKRGKKFPKLIVLDNPSSANFGSVYDILEEEVERAEQFAVVIVSKSGTTTETVANTAALMSVLARFQGSVSRVIAVSDAGTPLMDTAAAEGWHTLEIPHVIGGRFSVFSPAGLAVIGLMGIDTAEFLRGAETGVMESLVNSPHNVAALLAASVVAGTMKKAQVADTMYFSPQLSGLGLWYRQLIGESLGKKGKGLFRARTVPFPTMSIATADMHATSQMIFGSPRPMLTRFVSVAETHRDAAIAPHRILEAVPAVAGFSLHGLQRVMKEGIIRAYAAAKFSYLSLTLPSLSARTLGHVMAVHMIETLLAARMLGIDPFGQPHVELYKRHIREQMKKKAD